MKTWLPIALALALSLTACGQSAKTSPTPTPTEGTALATTSAPTSEPAPEPPASLPLDYSLGLSFSSGAGGWSTDIVLTPDGSFTGSFHDSDMGSSGPDYDSTRYVCDFTGTFSDIRDNGDGSWTMTLEQISVQPTPDAEWITSETDGDQTIRVRYVSSDPYGLETGTDFILYGPNTSVEGLDEEFLSWWPGRFEDPKPTTLDMFGLWNKTPGYGFFGSYIK